MAALAMFGEEELGKRFQDKFLLVSHLLESTIYEGAWFLDGGATRRLYTHLGLMWKNFQSTGCVLGGKSRVKVLSPDPRLLHLGQLLAKPRGVVPKEKSKA
jgi:hypothetical protein